MVILQIVYFQIHFVKTLSNLTFHFQTFPLNWHSLYLKHFSILFKVSFVFKRNDNDFRNKDKMNLNFAWELQHLVAANWSSLVLFKILEAVTNFGAPTFLKSSFTIIVGKRFLKSPAMNLWNMFWKSNKEKKVLKDKFHKNKGKLLKEKITPKQKNKLQQPPINILDFKL